MNTRSHFPRYGVVVLAATSLALAACGGDDASSATTVAETTEAPATTAAPATTEAAPEPTEAPATTAAPTTEAAPETTMAPATTVATEFDADQQMAADAWAVVFDSEASFDEKAPHLENADALKATVEAYAGAGSAMGGISLTPTGVEIADMMATVTYDVIFGGSPAYQGLTGEIAQVDGTWQVSQDVFCAFMAQARTPCS